MTTIVQEEVSATINSSGTQTVTCQFGSNVAIGDLLVLRVWSYSGGFKSSTSLQTIDAPVTSGLSWTLIDSATWTNYYNGISGNAVSFGVVQVYFAIATAMSKYSTNVTVIANGGSNELQIGYYEVAGIPNAVVDTSQETAYASNSASNPPYPNPATPSLTTSSTDVVFVSALAENVDTGGSGALLGVAVGYTGGSGDTAPMVAEDEYILSQAVGTFGASFTTTTYGAWSIVAVAFTSGAPPPPPCVPAGANGVVIEDLGLFIGPATALYRSPVPTANIAVNESTSEGRNAIILDFNDSEGLYARDLGVVFSWPVGSGTVLDLWQPSIVPEQDDLHNRLSYHFLINALGLVGWGHVRELNIAHNATANINLLLTFDQWPDINITIPNLGGETTKVKIVIPANKFKMVEGFLSSSQPFMLWAESCELKLGQWGRSDGYRVLKPFSG